MPTTYTWGVAGAGHLAAAILTYSGQVKCPSPGTASTAIYRNSSAPSSATNTSRGGSGGVTPSVSDTLRICVEATAGAGGGALACNGTERARVDGALPLLVSETSTAWSYPSAAQICNVTMLLSPDADPPPVAFVASSVASAAAASLTIDLPAGTAIGDTLVGFVACDIASAVNAPGWTPIAYNTEWGTPFGGLGSGTMFIYALSKDADVAAGGGGWGVGQVRMGAN